MWQNHSDYIVLNPFHWIYRYTKKIAVLFLDVTFRTLAKSMRKQKPRSCVPGNVFFVRGFTFHLRIFHSFGDVTITGEGLQILTYLGTHGHWAVRVLWRATPFVTRVNPIYNGYTRYTPGGGNESNTWDNIPDDSNQMTKLCQQNPTFSHDILLCKGIECSIIPENTTCISNL